MRPHGMDGHASVLMALALAAISAWLKGWVGLMRSLLIAELEFLITHGLIRYVTRDNEAGR